MTLSICPICAVFVDATGLPLDPQPEHSPKLGRLSQVPCIGHRLQLSQERMQIMRQVRASEPARLPYKD